jgi:hypothetical protein
MKTNELKKILKPLIKQCIKEVILEEGILSSVVSEVVQGLGKTPINESKAEPSQIPQEANSNKLNETRARMLQAVGDGGYNGVNVFEDVKPLRSSGNSSPSGGNPLEGVDPSDPGININGILKLGGNRWKNLI